PASWSNFRRRRPARGPPEAAPRGRSVLAVGRTVADVDGVGIDVVAAVELAGSAFGGLAAVADDGVERSADADGGGGHGHRMAAGDGADGAGAGAGGTHGDAGLEPLARTL